MRPPIRTERLSSTVSACNVVRARAGVLSIVARD